MRTALEERTGTKLESGRLYKITGNVGEIYDFAVYRKRTVHFRMSVPIEHREKIEFGKVYNVSVRSVDEVPLTKTQREMLLKSKRMRMDTLVFRFNQTQKEPGRDPSNPLAVGKSPVERNSVVDQLKQEKVSKTHATFDLVAQLQPGSYPQTYFRVRGASLQKKTESSSKREGTTRWGL